jgi:hypothetical protein
MKDFQGHLEMKEKVIHSYSHIIDVQIFISNIFNKQFFLSFFLGKIKVKVKYVCWKKNKWQYIIMQEKFALE